jgi:hypothetical protein
MTFRDYFLLVAICCMLIGAGTILLGARQLSAARSLARYGIRVPGIVVRFRNVGGEYSAPQPVVRFRTAVGQDVETTSRTGPRRWKISPGQAVTVTYDPRNPNNAVVGTGPSSAGCFGALATFVGSMFALGGVVLLLVSLMVP